MRAALRRPLVTGAASALTLELGRLIAPPPAGWLHDRWATLIAAARGGLVLESHSEIQYRVHDGQAVGLNPADVGRGGRRWRQVLARGASPFEAVRRAGDIVGRVAPLALDPAVRAELTWRAVLGSALDRT